MTSSQVDSNKKQLKVGSWTGSIIGMAISLVLIVFKFLPEEYNQSWFTWVAAAIYGFSLGMACGTFLHWEIKAKLRLSSKNGFKTIILCNALAFGLIPVLSSFLVNGSYRVSLLGAGITILATIYFGFRLKKYETIK